MRVQRVPDQIGPALSYLGDGMMDATGKHLPVTVADGYHEGGYCAKIYTLTRGDGRVLFVKEYADKQCLIGFPVKDGFSSVVDTLFSNKDSAIERARTILAEMA